MNSIEICANHRAILKKDLAHFVAMYEGNQTYLISSLADKIEHMCLNIGSPSSVIPMLKSIVKGKLKTWSTGDYNTNPYKLNPRIHIAELDRKHSDHKYNLVEGKKAIFDSYRIEHKSLGIVDVYPHKNPSFKIVFNTYNKGETRYTDGCQNIGQLANCSYHLFYKILY